LGNLAVSRPQTTKKGKNSPFFTAVNMSSDYLYFSTVFIDLDLQARYTHAAQKTGRLVAGDVSMCVGSISRPNNVQTAK